MVLNLTKFSCLFVFELLHTFFTPFVSMFESLKHNRVKKMTGMCASQLLLKESKRETL
jgi:hypothetical protein